MSEERFKKQLQDRRSELDCEQAPDGLWNKLDQELNQLNKPIKKEHKLRAALLQGWKYAAVFCVVICFAYFMGTKHSQPNQNTLQAINLEDFLEGPAVQDFGKVEQYYSQMILTKTDEIQSFVGLDHRLVHEFLKEHEELDSIYQELKILMVKDIDNQKVMDLMVLNLQLRKQILEKQLFILESVKRKKGNNNGNGII